MPDIIKLLKEFNCTYLDLVDMLLIVYIECSLYQFICQFLIIFFFLSLTFWYDLLRCIVVELLIPQQSLRDKFHGFIFGKFIDDKFTVSSPELCAHVLPIPNFLQNQLVIIFFNIMAEKNKEEKYNKERVISFRICYVTPNGLKDDGRGRTARPTALYFMWQRPTMWLFSSAVKMSAHSRSLRLTLNGFNTIYIKSTSNYFHRSIHLCLGCHHRPGQRFLTPSSLVYPFLLLNASK